MKKQPALQRLTNKQLEWILFGTAFAMMILSLFDPTSWAMFIVLVLAAPYALGFGAAMVVDYFDDRIQYKIEMSKKSHMILGLAWSVTIGMIWSVVGTRVPVFPPNPVTNAIFMAVAPKAVYLVWAFALAAFGYYKAWKTVIPNNSRGKM